jgi:prepilin-type N-terminal cleavage/methylation domain-containing protein/prepilin-type processing-associated H-X9-DG protein
MSTTTRAFTLIELLVVVAVIAILAGLLIPVISSIRAAAMATDCASDQRQILMASLVYSEDNRGYMTPCLYETPTVNRMWDTGYLAEYLAVQMTTAKRSKSYLCPAVQRIAPVFGANSNFGWNCNLGFASTVPPENYRIGFVRRNNITVPAPDFVVVTEGMSDLPGGTAGTLVAPYSGWTLPFVTPTNPDFRIYLPHRGLSGTAGFLDGHVTRLRKGDFRYWGMFTINPSTTAYNPY